MDGMTRAQVDGAEAKDIALGGAPMRPRDAATLILLDRKGGEFHVLMGRRSMKHAFMPGRLVFPGGRTDPADGRVATPDSLHPDVEAKLIVGTGSRMSATRARAIALSAVRETYEEAGLLIGRGDGYQTKHEGWHGFAENGVAPTLSNLRMIARAITPPGRVRRFDTRFIAAWRDDVAVELPCGPTEELEELVWLPVGASVREEMPMITRSILGDLTSRLAEDPALDPAYPVPFYRMRHKRMLRDLI